VITEVEADLDAFKKETIIKLCRKMEEAFHQQSQAAGDLRKETEEILFASLRDVFSTWRRQEIEKLSQKLADTHQDFATRINAILERLTQLTARIFDFSLRALQRRKLFPICASFGSDSEKSGGAGILQMTVTSLLPRAFTKGLLLKKLLKMSPNWWISIAVASAMILISGFRKLPGTSARPGSPRSTTPPKASGRPWTAP